MTPAATTVAERTSSVSAKPLKPRFLEVYSSGRAYALRACYAIIKFTSPTTSASYSFQKIFKARLIS
jgi:hypothetical protein